MLDNALNTDGVQDYRPPAAAQAGMVGELADKPLFSDLSHEDLWRICSYGSVRTYRKNTVLMTEYESGESLFVVRQGKVKVFVAEENGKEFTIGVFEPGELFGEFALIDGGTRSASAVTLERSQISVVSRAEFERCLAAHPGIALALIRRLVARLRTMTSDVKNLALRDVYGRIVRKLMELSHDRDGLLIIDERPTQQEFACMVGASREMVNRIMKGLVAGGYIELENKRMVIRRKLPPGW